MTTELDTEQRIERLEKALRAYLVMQGNPAVLTTNPANAAYGKIVQAFVNEVSAENQ